jgi:hypothetical protein
MADEATQRAWIKRVLGVEIPMLAAAKQVPPLMPIWRDAKEEVDAEIGKLQNALRAEEDEDLQVIVDFGLFGIGKQENVRLMAALLDADKAGTPDALAKVADAVEQYQAFLAASPAVGLLERNPFGVPVPMRQTLGGALAEIAKHAAA